MKDIEKTPQNVEELYKMRGRFLDIVYQGHIHSGIFEPGEDISLLEAARRFTNILIEKIPIGKGQRFLDVGCGIGVPAIELVKQKGCQVDGINISHEQIEQANNLAKNEQLENFAKFHVADAAELPFEEAVFDAGWFFDSILHMPRSIVYREAYRVLKPGGLLLVTDSAIPKGEPLTDDDFKILTEKAFITSPVTRENYLILLNEIGFEILEFNELPNVQEPTIRKLVELVNQYRDEILSCGSVATYNYLRDFHQKIYEVYVKNFDYFLINVRKP